MRTYGSTNTTYLHEISKEFGIRKKLVNLIKMTSQDSNGKVKIQGQMTEAFGTEIGLRQGDGCTVDRTVQYCTGKGDK